MYTTIETLWNKGKNKSEIARLTGHDWKTVDKVIKHLDKGKSAPSRKPHPTLLDSYQDELLNWISQGFSAVRAHEELLKLGVKVSYSTVKLVMATKRASKNIFMRIHTSAGEEAQVDFGYAGYTKDNQGKRRKTWIFNMRLSYSRLDYYEKVYDQKVETFILCHMHAFNYFGGVPKTIKIDNLKAAILEANFYEPVFQRLYQQMASYYGFESIPCRIYTPNDKGKVESGIKYVKNNFFVGRSFESGDELDIRLARWQEKANTRIHGTTKKVPTEVFHNEEKLALIKLPLEEFCLSKAGTRKVYHDCHIYIAGSYYSVPYAHVGKTVDITVSHNMVQVFYHGELIATHAKLKSEGEFSTKPEHYPRYKCLSSTEFQEKYQAKMAQIGEHAEKLFFCLLDEKKNAWTRPVQGIIALNKRYSSDVINRSCQRALFYGAYEYKVIKRICENGSYNLPIEYQGV